MPTRLLQACGLLAILNTSNALAESHTKSSPPQSVEITIEIFDAPASIPNSLIPDGTLKAGAQASTPSLPDGVLALAGVYTQEQLQLGLKDYRNNKEVDALASPPLFARSESKAIYKRVQEVPYATAYDEGKKPGDQPIPTDFENKEVGITFEATPVISSDNTTIDLTFYLRTCRLTGYMTLDGQKTYFKQGGRMADLYGAISQEYPDHANIQPFFATQEVTTQVTVYDGCSVLLGGLKYKDEATDTERNSFIVITARLILSPRANSQTPEARE